jgi:hypothetical protein
MYPRQSANLRQCLNPLEVLQHFFPPLVNRNPPAGQKTLKVQLGWNTTALPAPV